MIKNYLTIAWRNLARNKVFSFINIAGLSIGMACTMLILLWVYNERSWDSYNKNYKNIYHVMCNRNFNGEITTGPDMMYPLPQAAKANLAEVEKAAIVSFGETTLFTVGDKKLNKQTVTVSPDFFDIFSFDFIHGTSQAVKDPDAIILTESTAKNLFGSSDAVGQSVKVNNSRTAIVKAVIKDVPRNSTLQFDGVIPINPSSAAIKQAETDWVNCGNRVFFSVSEGVDIANLEKKVHDLVKKSTGADNPTTKGSVILHPMSKWRLYEEFKDGKNTGGRIQYVNLFTWIAIVILIIACVNFMNLSTARSEKRAKEVGIRKTLGSERQQLITQFIAESMLMATMAFLLAIIIVILAIPSFSNLLNEDVTIPFSSPSLWITITGIIVITGFVAGSYPAFYLSGFNPVKVLKGTFLTGTQALLPRKILVTSQFIVSVMLISASLIIYQQIQHVKNRDIGYDPNNLIMISSSPSADQNFNTMRNDLLQTGKIASVTRSSSPLTTILGFTSGIRWPGADEKTNLVIGFLFTDADFFKTVNAKIILGRDFRPGDSNTVIFNKEAIKLMGIKDPVGREITWAGRPRTIIGVADNMVMNSPYEAASPLMMCYEDKWSGNINIRLNDHADVKQSLALIETIYKKYSTEFPFEYKFTDEEFNRKFNNEQLVGKLSVIFTGLAIFVCCLGLFGLVSFSVERRKKELGIRKVLGASAQQLLMLISKEFLALVLLAFLIAIPAAWWLMSGWLKNFSYRINIGAGVFALSGMLIILIALITVGLNASKAIISKPAKSLRTE